MTSKLQTPGNATPPSKRHKPADRGNIDRNTALASPTDPKAEDSNIVIISHFGDLVLDVSKEGVSERVLAKVDTSRLRAKSKYFQALLDPAGFLEGRSVIEQQERLRATYANAKDIPDDDLPRVRVTDIGQTSSLKSIRPLVIDFLRIVHGYDVLRAVKQPPPVNIANLAVLADRFDCVDSVKSWATSKANVMPKIHASLPVYDEEVYRQRLVTCLFLGNESRLLAYSSHLILQGFEVWNSRASSGNRALWWDLPLGIEEELQTRRFYVLDAILSLQDYLLSLYTSRSRQCKLGYDTSPQCDSFQLGEFVKYLARIGTLRLHGSLADSDDPPEIASGEVRSMMKEMRAFSGYQLDPNHSHCGPRKPLRDGLEVIERRLSESCLGICGRCWKDPTCSHAWSSAKRPPFFSRRMAGDCPGVPAAGQCDKIGPHASAKDFFMAVDRGWGTLLNVH